MGATMSVRRARASFLARARGKDARRTGHGAEDVDQRRLVRPCCCIVCLLFVCPLLVPALLVTTRSPRAGTKLLPSLCLHTEGTGWRTSTRSSSSWLTGASERPLRRSAAAAVAAGDDKISMVTNCNVCALSPSEIRCSSTLFLAGSRLKV